MAQNGKKSGNSPVSGKKTWMRIAILVVALIMILSVIILPFIS